MALVHPRQGAWGAPERRDQLGHQVQVAEGHLGRRRPPDRLDKSPVPTTWWVNQELRNRHLAPQGEPGRQALPQAVRRQDQVRISEGHPGRRRRPDRLDKSPARTTWLLNQELRSRHRALQGQPRRQVLPQAVRRQDQVRVSEGHLGRRRPPDRLDKSPVPTTWWVNQELRSRQRAPQGQPGRQGLPQAVHRGWLPATATLPLRRQESDRLGPPALLMVWRQGCKAPTRLIPPPSQEQIKAAPVSRSTELRLQMPKRSSASRSRPSKRKEKMRRC